LLKIKQQQQTMDDDDAHEEINAQFEQLMNQLGATEETRQHYLNSPIDVRINMMKQFQSAEQEARIHSEAAQFIDKLLATNAVVVEESLIEQLLIHLKTESTYWVEEFILYGGMDCFIKILNQSQNSSSLVLSCLRAVVNVDVNSVLNHVDTLVPILLSLLTTDGGDTKTKTDASILISILILDSQHGFSLLFDLLNTRDLYKQLVQSVKQNEEEYSNAIILLLNSILNSCSDNTQRQLIKQQLINAGLPVVLTELKQHNSSNTIRNNQLAMLEQQVSIPLTTTDKHQEEEQDGLVL
jgi:hypothetical protein